MANVHRAVVVLCVLFVTVLPAAAATHTVTHTGDSGGGSLREILATAQNGDRIEFAIGGGGAQKIQPLSPLPAPSGCVTIDGTTQPGYAGTPLIEIDGALVIQDYSAGLNVCGTVQANGRLTTTGPIFSVLEATRPRITSISPQSAPAGSEIELAGEGFRTGYTFQIGGRTASIVSSSYTRATVRLAAELAPGRYDIQIINSASQLAAIGPAVTVTTDGLALYSVSARCSATGGGEQLTIAGRGFEGSMLVSFDTRLAGSATVADANTLIVTIPPGEAGAAQIRVTRADGATATLTNVFRYVSPFDPAGCTNVLRGGRAVRH